MGDIADAVYFIFKGSVSISDEAGTLLTRLGQGSHFGEMGCLAYVDGQLGEPRRAAPSGALRLPHAAWLHQGCLPGQA